MSMYEVIGTNNPTYLLADPQGCDKIAIPCKPGNGIVKRGTLMVRESTGLWKPAATGDIVNTNQIVVLDETVDTTGVVNGNKTIAEDAAAYRAGRFVRGKVTLANDGVVTAAHEVILRMQGIVFDNMVSTATFNNTVANG